jgi:hypothetical protein
VSLEAAGVLVVLGLAPLLPEPVGGRRRPYYAATVAAPCMLAPKAASPGSERMRAHYMSEPCGAGLGQRPSGGHGRRSRARGRARADGGGTVHGKFRLRRSRHGSTAV